MGDFEEPGPEQPYVYESRASRMARARRELGAYLRRRRESLGLSQLELAERSVGTKHPFDRSYIAHIETGRVTEFQSRFLNLVTLLFITPDEVREVMEGGDRLLQNEASCPLPELMKKVRAAADAGAYGKALSFALTGIGRAEAEGLAEWLPKFQLCASIVLRVKENWVLAKRFAESAFGAAGVDKVTRFRAADQLSTCCFYLGEMSAAKKYHRMYRATDFEHPFDRALWWHHEAQLALKRGNGAAAEKAVRAALDLYQEAGEKPGLARATTVLAHAIQAQGRSAEARECAAEAVVAAKASGEVAITLVAMEDYHRLLADAGMVEEAQAVLKEWEQLSQHQHWHQDLFDTDEGAHDRALSFALAGVEYAEKEGLSEWVPRFQLSASMASFCKGCWVLAKRFGEAALNAQAVDPALRFRASNHLVAVCLKLDHGHSAKSFQRLFDLSELDRPIDRAIWWHRRAELDLRGQDHTAGERAARAAVEAYSEADYRPGVVRAGCLLSAAVNAQGRGPEAREIAAQALAAAQKAGEAACILTALINQGRLFVRGLLIKEARRALLEAEQMAKHHERQSELFEARVALLDLGVTTDDRAAKKLMSRHVEIGLGSVELRIDPEVRRQAQQLLSRVEGEG